MFDRPAPERQDQAALVLAFMSGILLFLHITRFLG
jgi:hypothetical protein